MAFIMSVTFFGYQVFRAPILPLRAWSDIPGNTHMRGQEAVTGLCPVNCFPLPNYHPGIRHRPLGTDKLLASALMSQSHRDLTAASSSNFQLIINNALKAYEKRTKKDLLAHPLASQIQACNSPSAILAVLHQQVQELDQSQSSDDRWTKWLDPTVGVLYALSATLGEGVGLVSLGTSTCLRSALS
jgi:hypothetical protein